MTDLTRAIEGAKDGSVEVHDFGTGPIWIFTNHAIEVTAAQLAALRKTHPKKFKEM